jgi:hypothetical protein
MNYLNNKIMKYNILKNNKGYTLLFAVLVSSIVLAVGISILTISKKEFLLSSSARDSIVAFYAADSGLSCAIFNIERDPGNFSTTTASATLRCAGQDLSTTLPTPPYPSNFRIINFNGATDVFDFDLKTSTDPNSQTCAVITVRKYYDNTSFSEPIPMTSIISKGYNLGWNSSSNTCSTASPRRVERAIEYTF